MNKIFMTAVCALATTGVFAQELPLKIFVGGNLAATTVAWDKDVKDAVEELYEVKLPEWFLGGGLEAGVKYAPDQIYNFGITVAYDYMFNAEGDKQTPEAKRYINEFETGFSSISATFDNYIRFANDNNRRSDMILGIGLGRVTERIKMQKSVEGKLFYNELIEILDSMGEYELADVLEIAYADQNEKDNGTAVVFKLAYNQEITDRLDLNFAWRLFIPTVKDGDVDAASVISAGVRYNF